MKFEDLDNLEKIENGTVFKNRRHLCDFLGIEYVKSGKAVRLQLDKIDNIFTHKRDGHKIIVTDMFPLAIVELNFQLSNNRQKQISELLILNLILGAIDNEDDALVINQNVLIPYLALANQNYIYYYYNKNNELAKKLKIEIDHIKTLDNWLQSVRGVLTRSIESAIKQLEKEGYIMHNKVYKVQIVHQKNDILVDERLNEFGDKETDYKSKHSEIKKGIRLATNTETNRILAIEQEVLEELKMTKKDLFLQGKYDMFNRMCRDKTISELGVGFYFLCHKFNFADGFIKKKKDIILEQLQGENINALRYEQNRLICERVKDNSQNRVDSHNNNLQQIDDEMDRLEDHCFGVPNGNQINELMKRYEKELGRDYINTDEHKNIEDRLVEFLLVIEDLQEDVKNVWYNKIKK